jgi:hypothetical protein
LFKNVYVYIESLPSIEELGFVPKVGHEYKEISNAAKTVEEMRQAIVELYMRIVPAGFEKDLERMLRDLKRLTKETIIIDAYYRMILHKNSNILPKNVANEVNLVNVLRNKTSFSEEESDTMRECLGIEQMELVPIAG